ncbi:MAG: SAM-dependent methyltransferase [Betaproteobacteria bacterium]|nr:SAM-dependent methyltransferase [Betaproteobacteria bacterium]
MSGYATKQEIIAVAGVDDLIIRSLLDRLQYADPDGDAERLGISSALWPLFGLLWPSGAHLAARMAEHPVVPAERILEIGCGLALASLVGHRRGADVTASDRHPLAERFLKENLRVNALAPMKYQHGNWASPDHIGRSNAVAGEYDLIIGSDLLYERDDNADLAGFIARHASPHAAVWIIDPNRSNRAAFHRQMAAGGFLMQEERIDLAASMHSPAYHGRCLIYARGIPKESLNKGARPLVTP